MDPTLSEHGLCKLGTRARSPASAFWRRRLADPILAQLTQGCSADKIALSIAVAVAASVFPMLGVTTLLCLAAGMILKLNQPLLQLINVLLYPLQIVLFLVFARIGEWMFHAPRASFSFPRMVAEFHARPAHFFSEFAATFAYGVTAWLIIAPAVIAIFYFSLRPVLQAAERRVRR